MTASVPALAAFDTVAVFDAASDFHFYPKFSAASQWAISDMVVMNRRLHVPHVSCLGQRRICRGSVIGLMFTPLFIR